ncbi:unnamed protein product [Caenorhabditis sp. 36 PRJEB53466]|nr:unnamed protein product [Caenorhabditis sp. 36 PRJEB53466]
MSIIHVESEFAIIDEQQFYEKVFEKSNLKMRPEFFEIHSEFMPDSQFEAIKKRGVSTGRKRTNSQTHSEDVTWIREISTRIRTAGQDSGYFKSREPATDNNKTAREAAARAVVVRVPSGAMTSSEQVVEVEKRERVEDLMCNGMISNWIRFQNNSPVGIIRNSDGIQFFLPPNSTFHVGDVADIEQFSAIHDVLFDLVVADPPWFCRSVKRTRMYDMNEQVLERLDPSKFAAPEALLVFWVTNRRGIEEEMEKRIEKWDMEVIATWKWLKVTTQGDPVYNFENPSHKVPFENVMFAMRKGAERPSKFALPEKFVFASVPMAVHSHKPPLFDLLRHFGVEFSRPLELFARSLLPATHSVGFEPFLLQSERVFVLK